MADFIDKLGLDCLVEDEESTKTWEEKNLNEKLAEVQETTKRLLQQVQEMEMTSDTLCDSPELSDSDKSCENQQEKASEKGSYGGYNTLAEYQDSWEDKELDRLQATLERFKEQRKLREKEVIPEGEVITDESPKIYYPSHLKTVAMRLSYSTDEENIAFFRNVLRFLIYDGSWLFYIANKNEEGKFMFPCIEEKGKFYVPIFTGPEELPADRKGTVLKSSINKAMDAAFKDKNISGIVINPYSDQLYVEKWFVLNAVFKAGL